MSKIVNWLRQNKLASLLMVVVVYLLVKGSRQRSILPQGQEMGGLISRSSIAPDYAPAPEVKDRLVIQESSLSLLVKKVSEAQKAIIQKAQSLDGYLVNSNLSSAEGGEAVSGSISVRIPQPKLAEGLDYFRNLAVKVVSENLSGEDVTDQYVDIKARLDTLLTTKTKFEGILAKAENIQDILQVQQQLINLQAQIDSLKGQQQFLEKSSQMSKVTVYLSTDELSLPYAPAQSWRPNVIFKQAVRSLIGSLRKVATGLIWLGVYSVILLPVLGIFFILHKRLKK